MKLKDYVWTCAGCYEYGDVQAASIKDAAAQVVHQCHYAEKPDPWLINVVTKRYADEHSVRRTQARDMIRGLKPVGNGLWVPK